MFFSKTSDSDYEMDIRSINGIINNTAATTRADNEKKAEIKSDSSHERDANGQMFRGQEEGPRELTEEELNRVIETLKAHPGVKDNNLTVSVRAINDKHFVLIEDPTGKVVRRVAAKDLWHLLKDTDKDTKKGRIFNKAL